MLKPMRFACVSWPVLAGAVVLGVLEWAALWRSRALDAPHRWSHARPRR